MANKRPVQLFHIAPSTIQHLIDLAIKIFTVIITIPATWGVASLVYDSRLVGLPLLLVKTASVGVVDGVFMASIWIIEGRKTIADSEKIVNATIVWVLYAMLLFIAIENGEGAIGLIFRVAIAIYLLRITQATLAASFRRAEKQESTEGIRVKWLARLLSLLLVVRQMLAEFRVKLRISGARQSADIRAIKGNAENFDMIAQDRMFLHLFEDEGANKPLLALSGPGTVNSGGQRFYNLSRTPDGQYVGECPVCGDKRHGDTPYSVILLIQGHLKEHSKGRTEEGTPLSVVETTPSVEPDFS